MLLRSWLTGYVGVILAFEYSINYERVELSYVDKTLLKDGSFLFRKYNRTNFCLNISFTLLKDLDGNEMKFTTSGYQLLSNQYKPTGFKVGFNVCDSWKRDIYGSTTYIKQFGNLEGCDIKKGNYHLHNYMPDDSQLPKYAPLGSYMVEINVEWNSGVPICKVHWYITSKFKLSRKKNRRSNSTHILN